MRRVIWFHTDIKFVKYRSLVFFYLIYFNLFLFYFYLNIKISEHKLLHCVSSYLISIIKHKHSKALIHYSYGNQISCRAAPCDSGSGSYSYDHTGYLHKFNTSLNTCMFEQDFFFFFDVSTYSKNINTVSLRVQLQQSCGHASRKYAKKIIQSSANKYQCFSNNTCITKNFQRYNSNRSPVAIARKNQYNI
jgi:hypothetical protein